MKTNCCHSKKVQLESDYHLCMNADCENYMRPTAILKSNKNWNNIFILFFSFFFFLITFNDFSISGPSSTNLLQKTFKADVKPLNKENVRQELDSNHIICPEQVFAQIMIESGHLNSYLSLKTNNLLGMRYPFKRKTSAVGLFLPESNMIIRGTQQELKKYRLKNHYAVFDNWQDCIKDYKFWQDQSFKLTEKYLTFLGTCYAEDSLYVDKIKKITK